MYAPPDSKKRTHAMSDSDASRNLVLSNFEPYLNSLKPKPIWVGWKKVKDEERPGKFRKPPYSARDGSRIGAGSWWPTTKEEWESATPARRKWRDEHPGERYSDHWLPFADAWPGVIKHKELEGIGLVIRKEDRLVGVDFDNCVINGVIDPKVEWWLKTWFSHAYAEFSPSGNGVHVLGLGRISKSINKQTPFPGAADGVTVEVYNCDRFFTFSGKPVAR